MSVIYKLWSHRYLCLNVKSKTIKKGIINRFLVVIHITFMLISCKNGNQNTEKSILRFNSATGITSLDPAFARTQENIRTVNQLFNGLVQLDSNLNVAPSIAKKWTISGDGKLYTFILNKGVLFHNHPLWEGEKREVNAYDFVYSFERIIDPTTASDGAWIFNGIVDESEPFVALNDTTFQLRLNKPFAPLLSMLTMAYCYVVPQEVVQKLGQNFGKNPVGTGPFRFANWADGIKLNLIKNENYFESTSSTSIPGIDAISVSFIQSKQTELLEFTQGKLDLFTGIESSFKDEILTADGTLTPKYREAFVLKKSPFLNTEYLAFNMDDAESPIADVNLRKAIHHCIDREAMIKYLRNGVGIPAEGGFCPKGLPSYTIAWDKPYDLVLAKDYLQKVASPPAEPLTLTTTSNYLDLCILVQENCAEIGIPIKIDVVPSSLLKQRKSSGDLAFFRSSWIADYPDGENYMACFYGPNKAPNGPNYTRFDNADFDSWYEQLLTENIPAKRMALFAAMQRILEVEQPYALLFYDESIWLRSKTTKHFKVNALNHLDLRYVTIEK
jgi:ABC-type transport system substrate-binding protein